MATDVLTASEKRTRAVLESTQLQHIHVQFVQFSTLKYPFSTASHALLRALEPASELRETENDATMVNGMTMA